MGLFLQDEARSINLDPKPHLEHVEDVLDDAIGFLGRQAVTAHQHPATRPKSLHALQESFWGQLQEFGWNRSFSKSCRLPMHFETEAWKGKAGDWLRSLCTCLLPSVLQSRLGLPHVCNCWNLAKQYLASLQLGRRGKLTLSVEPRARMQVQMKGGRVGNTPCLYLHAHRTHLQRWHPFDASNADDLRIPGQWAPSASDSEGRPETRNGQSYLEGFEQELCLGPDQLLVGFPGPGCLISRLTSSHNGLFGGTAPSLHNHHFEPASMLVGDDPELQPVSTICILCVELLLASSRRRHHTLMDTWNELEGGLFLPSTPS